MLDLRPILLFTPLRTAYTVSVLGLVEFCDTDYSPDHGACRNLGVAKEVPGLGSTTETGHLLEHDRWRFGTCIPCKMSSLCRMLLLMQYTARCTSRQTLLRRWTTTGHSSHISQ